MNNLGALAVLFYFCVFYFPGLLLLALIGPHPYFKYEGNVLLIYCVIVSTLFLAFLFTKSAMRLPTGWARRLPNIYENKVFTLALGVVMLPISVKFFLEFGMSFRYTGGGLASAGLIPQIVFLYKGVFFSYIIYGFLIIANGLPLGRQKRFLILLLSFNWALCATGSMEIIWLGVGLCLAVFGQKAAVVFFVDRNNQQGGLARSFCLQFIALFLGISLGCCVIFFGFANKIGMDSALELFSGAGVVQILNYMYYRLSWLIPPIEILSAKELFDFRAYEAALGVLADSLSYRLGTVLGYDVAKSEYGGLNQLNYYSIYVNPANDRSGASPGPIGTFLYIPFFPFNVLAASTVLAALANSITRAAPLPSGRVPTIFAGLFLAIVASLILHNPIEAFVQIGPNLVLTFMFLYCLEKVRIRATARPS